MPIIIISRFCEFGLFCFVLFCWWWFFFFLYSFFQCLPNPPVCFQAGARFSVEGASQMPFPQAHKTLRQNTAGRKSASLSLSTAAFSHHTVSVDSFLFHNCYFENQTQIPLKDETQILKRMGSSGCSVFI